MEAAEHQHKSILFLAYWFALMHAMGARRTTAFYKYFKERAWTTRVLVSNNRHLVKKDEYQLDENDIKEIRTWDFRRIHKIIVRKSNTQNKRKLKQSIWYSVFSKLANSFPFNLIFGEGSIVYIINSYRAAVKSINKNRTKVILSSYAPMADHFIAYLLKRKFRNLLWVADFRDLHVDPFRGNVFLPALQRSIDALMLKKANIISCASAGLMNNLTQTQPDARNFRVIYNKINLTVAGDFPAVPPNKFLIAYTGTLYKWQYVEWFFRVLKNCIASGKLRAEDLLLVYCGANKNEWDNKINKWGLKEINLSTDIYPHRISISIQQTVHINLLLSWSNRYTNGVLTGKLFEYIQSPADILALVNGNKDAEIEYWLKMKTGSQAFYNAEDNDGLVEEWILSKYQSWLIGDTNHEVTLDGTNFELAELEKELDLQLSNRKLPFTSEEKMIQEVG